MMKMNTMKQFIQSAILLAVLTAISIPVSPFPYLYIMLAGGLMVIFGIRSVSEGQNAGLLLVLGITAFAYAYCAGNFMGFLVFYEVRLERVKFARIVFPGVLYGITLGAAKTLILPEVIVRMIMLVTITGLLYLMEMFVERYLSAVEQVSGAVSVTAVNEMYEKKLNHELVIKNYLADRNARLEERETISRNIHNNVGHSITAAIMTLDAADMLFDAEPERAREKMNTANERIRTSLNTIRCAVRVLDKENEFVDMADFIRELTTITDSFVMDTQIRLRTDFSEVDSGQRIPHEYAEFLTGAVSEFLTNGVRHGGADMYTIMAVTDSSHIKVSVKDNGNSDFSPENRSERIQNGFGLKKIEAYVRKCGGTITFVNEQGFRAVVVLPLFDDTRD